MLFEHLIVHIHFILDLILNIAKALMNRTILKSALYKYIYLSIERYTIYVRNSEHFLSLQSLMAEVLQYMRE